MDEWPIYPPVLEMIDTHNERAYQLESQYQGMLLTPNEFRMLSLDTGFVIHTPHELYKEQIKDLIRQFDEE